MLTIGSLLENRYRIERVLGSGGMGAVYLASDTRLPRQWAVKEMHDQFEDEDQRQQAKESFVAEATLLAQLEHPNLPRIVDFFQTEGRHFLVMDFVEGQTLEQRLVNGPLSLREGLDIGRQIAEVLQYLHERPKPIVFRDLKPANIILVDGKTVKLIDFGIARLLRPGASSDTRALGTPGYAAPEQYGRGQSDARTDVYALGATLHHGFSGVDPQEHPFQFAPFREKRPDVPEKLEQILLRAVTLKPDGRFQTASDFLDALRTVENDPATGQLLGKHSKTASLDKEESPPVMVSPAAPPVASASPATPSTQVAATVATGFEPRNVHLGKIDSGVRAKSLVRLIGKVEGKVSSSNPAVSVSPARLQGTDPNLEIVFDTRKFPDGGHQWAEISFKGKPEGVAPLRIEVEVQPRKLQAWTYPLALLLATLTFIPAVGMACTLGLGMMVMGAPRSQSGGLRFFFWLSMLISVGYALLGALALTIWNH